MSGLYFLLSCFTCGLGSAQIVGYLNRIYPDGRIALNSFMVVCLVFLSCFAKSPKVIYFGIFIGIFGFLLAWI